MDKKHEITEKIRGGLIVSCQALKDEPLHGAGIMAKMSLAAVHGGAKAIRTNGIEEIKQIKSAVNVPVIGLFKVTIKNFPVYITPTSRHAIEVARAGADMIAIDCTKRLRPEPLDSIFESIRKENPDLCIIADISTLEDAEEIIHLNPDFLATTLSGYTDNTLNRPKPDIELVKVLSNSFQIPIIAEGNFWKPEQAVEALKAGAHSVTIGSAITRPQLITKRFSDFIQNKLLDSQFSSTEDF